MNNIVWSSIFFLAVVFGLSIFASIPYIYTVCGLSVLIVFGHLVTLDDDMPGEWSNIEYSDSIWHQSKIQLTIKVVAMLVIIAITLAYPSLSKFGA